MSWSCPKCHNINSAAMRACDICHYIRQSTNHSEMVNAQETTISANEQRLYQIMDIPMGASLDEIKEAYANLSRVWDVERYGDNPQLKAKAQDKVREIDAAYAELILRHQQRVSQAAAIAGRKGMSEETRKELDSRAIRVPQEGASTASADAVATESGHQKNNRDLPKSVAKWINRRSAIIAFFLTLFLAIVATAIENSQGVHNHHKNMVWTFCWMYLTVDTWKYWGWKALLPYPGYLGASFLVAAVNELFFDRSMGGLVMLPAGNIVGLLIFHNANRKAAVRVMSTQK